jgi:hypothetical protein
MTEPFSDPFNASSMGSSGRAHRSSAGQSVPAYQQNRPPSRPATGVTAEQGTAPEFSYEEGCSRATWAQLALVFDLLRLDRRTGEVTAEVKALSNGDVLHLARLNLTSTRSKAELAARLKAIKDVDWHYLLEQACQKTVEAYRRGEPALLLRDAPLTNAGDEFALGQLLLAGHPTVYFGDGGSGKSYLALAAAIDMHADAGLLGLPVRQPRAVAYIDWELDASTHRQRMREMVGEREPGIVYLRCDSPLAEEVERLRLAFREYQVEFAVLDSASLGTGGPLEESSSAVGWWQAVRRLRVGTLTVAHINRAGDVDRAFGSTFWHNGCRSAWYVKGSQEPGSHLLYTALVHKKANTGPLHKPLGYCFDFNRRPIGITAIDVRNVPELASQAPLKDRMNGALRGGPRTYRELAEELATDPNVIKTVANRYKRVFTKLPNSDGRREVRIALVATNDGLRR